MSSNDNLEPGFTRLTFLFMVSIYYFSIKPDKNYEYATTEPDSTYDD